MIANDLFLWTDDLRVDIRDVDEQHKGLFDLIKQLQIAISEKHEKEAAREILDQLAESTRQHFLLEESLMRLTHYPEFAAHKNQHESLMEQMRTLQHKLDNESAAINIDLLQFLYDWLTKHIGSSDQRFSKHFEKSELGQAPAVAPGAQQKWWRKYW